jgi:hypothetical protein
MFTCSFSDVNVQALIVPENKHTHLDVLNASEYILQQKQPNVVQQLSHADVLLMVYFFGRWSITWY